MIPIAPALLPYVTEAIDASPSEWVFPADDGTMRAEEVQPIRLLRTAMARAGLVDGYQHVCRRCKSKGEAYVERHRDAELRLCPRCGMKLWPRAVHSKMRFHDLRHTTATLLLRAGVDAHRVQRILRHASVTTTTSTYAHLVTEDLRDAVGKIGPQAEKRAPFADRLRTESQVGHASTDEPPPNRFKIKGLKGAPDRSRTCGPRLRRPLLYPAELQARAAVLPRSPGRVKHLASPRPFPLRRAPAVL